MTPTPPTGAGSGPAAAQLPPTTSLAQRFAWGAALLAGLAVALIAAGSWWWTDRLQREAAAALQAKDTELRAARVASTLRSLHTRLAELAANPLLTTALTDSEGRDAYLRPYLGSVQSINAVPLELLLADFQGLELARNGDTHFSPAQLARVREALQQGRADAWLDGAEDDLSLLAVTLVVYPRTGTVEGALLAKVQLNALLVDPGFALRPQASLPVADAAWRADVALPEAFSPVMLEVHGPPQALNQVLPGRGQLAAATLLATGLLVTVVVLVGTRLARRLTADLAALDHFARSVAEQTFGDSRAPLTGTTEVRGLAQSVNRMLDRLNQQHVRLQNAAEAQLHLLATCIEQLNDVVMICEAADPECSSKHRIVFVNQAFERLTGYARHEVLGRTPHFLQGPGSSRTELDRVGAALQRWEPVRAEVLNYAKDGRAFWIEMAIVPVKNVQGRVTHWVSVERDTTARREAEAQRQQLETQLREVQKMEAIGTLAGGIAHDFNNVLAAILGNVQLADQALQGPPTATGAHPARAPLAQVRRSAERARSLVQQILTFSRRQTQPQAPQALRPLVEEAVALLRATVPARVQLHTRLQAEATGRPLTVMGDATALSQVLMNLGTNAWHALSGSTGRVEFGLESLRWPEQVPQPLPAGAERLPPGPVAHLWVADDGCGMDATTRARLFEPFFTTKPVGTGTGMGLAVVLGIVQAHHGIITVDSAPGAGTCFHIYLPQLDAAAAPAAEAPTGPAAAAGTRPGAASGSAPQVLYVDDDEVMVTVAEALLQGWGYRVHTERRAPVALALLRAEPERFDVLVTDFNMPELSGLDLLRAARALNPRLPVILTSGYLPDDLRAEARRAGANALLRKETLTEELAPLLAQVLETVAQRAE